MELLLAEMKVRQEDMTAEMRAWLKEMKTRREETEANPEEVKSIVQYR
jgi:hypothetical protein